MRNIFNTLISLISKILYVSTHEFCEKFHIRRRPRVIQLPITSRCNSACVTCNVWKKEFEKKDVDAEQLTTVLRDPFFKKVNAVGVNGGELSLHPHFIQVIESILTLPRIKYISVISNGLLTEKLLSVLKETKKKCEKKSVILTLTLSIDGVGEVQERVRGVTHAYMKVYNTLISILNNQQVYCDHINIGCTISSYNVYYLPQMELLSQQLHIPIEFHLAVPNKRIHTFEDANRYSVLADTRATKIAAEFFYKKMEERSSSMYDALRYFMQYKFLTKNGEKRMALCSYKYQDVTVDENLNLYLCATASDCIGNLQKETPKQMFEKGKIKEMENKTFKNCNTCIHYCWQPTFKALLSFLFFKIRKTINVTKFKFLLKWKL